MNEIWFNIVIKMNSDIILLCRLYNHSTWTSQKHSRHLDQIISNSDTARSRSMIIRELFVRSTYYAGIRRCLNEWDLIWFNIVIKMNSDIILLCRLYNHSTWTSQKHSRHLDQIISNSDTARSRSMIIRELFVRSTYYAGIRRCLN